MDDRRGGGDDSRGGWPLSSPGSVLAGPTGKRRVATSLLRQPVVLISTIVLIAWILIGVTAPFLPLSDPNDVLIEQKLASPSAANLFGTDELGRDVLSRVAYAARVSLPAGSIVVILSVLIGSAVGAIAGEAGGMVDQSIMRLCDAVLSFPTIILAMAIATIRGGPGIDNVVLAVVLVLWPEYARLMRGQVLSLKERDFVLAARASGATAPRIYLRHIVPSANAPIVVKATLDVGGAILLTASLSFLGFGAIPPTSEWGAMVSQGSRVGLQFWWASAFPALAIVSVVMALNFLGDGLRDALDPRGK